MTPLLSLATITGLAANSLTIAQIGQQGPFVKPPYGGTQSDPWGSPQTPPINPAPAPAQGKMPWDGLFPKFDPVGDAGAKIEGFVKQQGTNVALVALIVLSIYALLRGGD